MATTKRAKSEHPPGPRDCMRSKTLHIVCDVCGEVPDVAHMPTRAPGWFCPGHCPCCAPKPVPLGPPKAAPEVDFDHPAARVRD